MPFKKSEEKEPELDELDTRKEFETPETELEIRTDFTEELNEIKHNTFLRLAKARTQKIINGFRILGNCSNKSTYAYTEAELLKIFNSINKAFEEMKEKFETVTKQKEVFEF